MKKKLRNLGLILAILGGIGTANFAVKSIQAEENNKKNRLEIFIEKSIFLKEGKELFDITENVAHDYHFYADIYIENQMIGSINEYHPLKTRLNSGSYFIEFRGYFANDQQREQREIKIKSDSKLKIIAKVIISGKYSPDHSYDMFFGDLIRSWDSDDDKFIDSIEEFFGTDPDNKEDNLNTRGNLYLKKINNDMIFYSILKDNNFKYNIKNYNDTIRGLENALKEQGADLSSAMIEERNYGWNTGITEKKERYNQIENNLEQAKKDKESYLSNSIIFKFTPSGDSLEIFFKPYTEKEWKDITNQKNFYKDYR